MDIEQESRDYKRVEKALEYLHANYAKKPSLKQIAQIASLSEYHFQRIFSRWAGLSPERFMKYLCKENAKRVISESRSLLEATYGSNLSSQGRLHDLIVSTEAVTPGELKTKGQGLVIEYGFHPTPFGICFIAETGRGICALEFADKNRSSMVSEFYKRWENALVKENKKKTALSVKAIFEPFGSGRQKRLNVLLSGTNFQIKVWEALLRIPPGGILSYEDLAIHIDRPTSVRAVAGAVGSNKIAYLIPCHRVIRKMGVISGYRWGSARKMAMLARESSLTDAEY